MATTLKSKAIVLTTTLSTNLLTAGAGEIIDISHLIASVSADGGSFTFSITDTSGATTSIFCNGITATKNKPFEQFDLRLESGDILSGGHTSATGASALITYSVRT